MPHESPHAHGTTCANPEQSLHWSGAFHKVLVVDPIAFQMYDGSGFREAALCLGWELPGSGWLKSHRCDGFFLQENIVKVEVMKIICVSLQKVLLISEK
jgi:hypothetical protein